MTNSQRKNFRHAGKRIGLLGGSFNPAHDGHVEISLFAIKRLKLDEVWWLVSPQNPLKNRDEMKSFVQRYNYACTVTKVHKKIIITQLESQFKTTYTHETLRLLKDKFCGVKFVWLMGEDNLNSIDKWKNWRQIFLAVPIAVFRRKGYSNERVKSAADAVYAEAKLPLASAKKLVDLEPPSWMVLDNEFNSESATRIRNLKSRSTSSTSTNPPNEGVLTMVAKKPVAKKKTAAKKKPAAKKKTVAKKKPAAKKTTAKKTVKKKTTAKKTTAKKATAKKTVKKKTTAKKTTAKKATAKKTVKKKTTAKKTTAKKATAKKTVKKKVAKKPATKKKTAVKKTVKKKTTAKKTTAKKTTAKKKVVKKKVAKKPAAKKKTTAKKTTAKKKVVSKTVAKKKPAAKKTVKKKVVRKTTAKRKTTRK